MNHINEITEEHKDDSEENIKKEVENVKSMYEGSFS